MRSEALKEEKRHGLTIKIFSDDDPRNPREDDNIGAMVCFHNRYTLGDKTDLSAEQFNGWDELRRYLIKEKGAKVILPLFLYDHSGISMRTFPHGVHAAWDCGQVGFIYATTDQIKKEYGAISRAVLNKVRKNLMAEVETYDDYLTGNVYGYRIETEAGEEAGDTSSVWGFFGDYAGKYGALTAARKEVDAMTHKGTTDHKGQKLMAFAIS